MKFKVLRGTAFGGQHGDKFAGDTIELPESEGRFWVLKGRLAPADGQTVKDPTKEGLLTTMGEASTATPKRGRKGGG